MTPAHDGSYRFFVANAADSRACLLTSFLTHSKQTVCSRIDLSIVDSRLECPIHAERAERALCVALPNAEAPAVSKIGQPRAGIRRRSAAPRRAARHVMSCGLVPKVWSAYHLLPFSTIFHSGIHAIWRLREKSQDRWRILKRKKKEEQNRAEGLSLVCHCFIKKP